MKYAEMTSHQLRAVNRDSVLVVIPIAAVEQHGPHMPTGTDTILCTHVAELLEQRMKSSILLTPTIWLGASAHHLPFGATLDHSLNHYIDTLADLAKSILNDGYRRILFLNGHGGNIDPMRIVIRNLQIAFPNCVLSAGCYWDVIDLIQLGILEGEHQFVGHACEFETSLMLHIRPELVDVGKIKPADKLVPDEVDGVYLCRDMSQRTTEGFTGRPDLATAEKGEQLLGSIVTKLELLVKKLLATE